MIAIQKNYTIVAGKQLFYRRAGNGPVIFLLHPSPRSSAMLEPFIALLSDSFTVIAPDTPGYGLSEPTGKTISSVYDYNGFIYALHQQITEEPIYLYGTASGAQLALAYAITHPQKVKLLYLDNAAHFDSAAREELLKKHFIDISPKEDGSHLTALWQMLADACLYFPWYDKSEENRFADTVPPPTVIQGIVNDYLQAGPNYYEAYIAAFKHERAEKVQALKVPTVLFRWLGSPILKHIDALLKHSFPEHISIVETPADMGQRYRVMKETIRKSVSQSGSR
ncbi:MAG: alpha/beta hydrolase [Chitinophagaceae bacterium]|nr:alpha/beta hydrolase [Chitinophagaceae bacterium]